MLITASLIPHSQFHLGAWLIPVEKPTWYYFMKKKNNNHITNASFIESVDEPLKELVKFLHIQGIKTTPSCAGHYRTLKDYNNAYTGIEGDAKKIRANSLKLMDIETGKIYLYKNKNYMLPWSRPDFLDRVMDYQQKGVLGMRLGNRKKIRGQILDLKFNGVSIYQKDGLLLIELQQETKKENLLAWKKITEAIRKVFIGINQI